MTEHIICPHCKKEFDLTRDHLANEKNIETVCPNCSRLFLLYPFLMFRPPQDAPTYWDWEKEVPDGIPPADRRDPGSGD